MSSPYDPGTGLPGEERPSIGELLSEVTTNLSDLIRQELELAKAELRQTTSRVGKGAGMLGGAGVAANLMLVFLSVAAWWAIGNATGRGWSGLIVAAFWALVALVLALVGRKEIRSASGIPRTTETVKRIPGALQGNEPGHREPAIDLTDNRTTAARAQRANATGTSYPTGTGRPSTMNEEDLR
jgi:uncharacterized membrane protein YqjE